MRDPQSIAVNEDARMIPAWSIVVAIVAFLLVEYYFFWILPQQQHHPPPLGLRLYQNIRGPAGGALFPDGGLRQQGCSAAGMSSRFWMLMCFVMPGGIGAVLYFLLRQPEVSRCPACATQVQSDFHFCPQCNYQLTANCGNCFRTVRATDQFCTRCGHELANDQDAVAAARAGRLRS